MQLDVAIFGGGAAGLWLLDTLARAGSRVLLLEAGGLGSGQTISSQGIIHGGLKYTLQGLLTRAASSIRDMPLVWRNCLAGSHAPDLRRTRVRARCCYLWQTESLSSRLGMIGAQYGLRIAPARLGMEERPTLLASCPGIVARLEEQVISPGSFLEDLASQHRDRILKIDADSGLEFTLDGPGQVGSIHLRDVRSGGMLELQPAHVVLTAGAGNGSLRTRVGLSATAMQRRPLHMVLVRGPLPPFSGHCVDGAKTRVTITSDTDALGRTVWQIGGELAENGIHREPLELIWKARAELQAVIPGLDLSGAEWTTYCIDRAEGATAQGQRPESVQMLVEGNVLTGWPTKLALAPVLAGELASRVMTAHPGSSLDLSALAEWPRPSVAQPPWETCRTWHRLERDIQTRRAA